MKGIVLIVEDDEDVRDVVSQIVAEAGFATVSAEHDALPEISDVALVVADLPPVARGYSPADAATWVMVLRARYGAPVVVLTAHAAAAADTALLGICTVVRKPFEIDALVSLVRASMPQISSSVAPAADRGPGR